MSQKKPSRAEGLKYSFGGAIKAVKIILELESENSRLLGELAAAKKFPETHAAEEMKC